MGIRLLTWLLAFIFIGAGIPKVLGLEQAVEGFTHFGYSAWFRLFIGAAEIAGGIGLLIPSLTRMAAVGLLAIMAGAIWTLWSVGESPLPPLVIGGMLAARIGLGSSATRD